MSSIRRPLGQQTKGKKEETQINGVRNKQENITADIKEFRIQRHFESLAWDLDLVPSIYIHNSTSSGSAAFFLLPCEPSTHVVYMCTYRQNSHMHKIVLKACIWKIHTNIIPKGKKLTFLLKSETKVPFSLLCKYSTWNFRQIIKLFLM